MRAIAFVLIAACGSATPTSQPPTVATVPADAAVPDASPDAGVPADVASAPAWIFRYNAADRLETWTLRYHGGIAALDVQSKTGTLHYLGTTSGDESMHVDVATGNARMALDCKHEQLAVGATCGDKKAAKQDVLACYHPDFKAPMPFGPAPGVEYVATPACTGYRTAN
ncbi:MAG TPA: hypothetical protein VGG28_12665 [Kofleriaceae bacterium]|jgi:hypothetical protein